MSSVKQKLVISRPPMLTIPSWPSSASHMILSRKMLKRVGESRHCSRTPTVVLNPSPVLPLNRPCGHLLGKSCPLGFSLMLFLILVPS